MLQTSLLMSDNLAGILPLTAGTGIDLQIPATTGIPVHLYFRPILKALFRKKVMHFNHVIRVALIHVKVL